MNESPLKILLLEDHADDAELIQIELEKADFDFTLWHASDEKTYLELLESDTPDLVLCDYNIPGYDVHKAMDALPNLEVRIPFIVVTGALGDEKAVDLIVNHGVSDYILKDNLARLNSSISREFKNTEIQRENARNKKELEKLSLVASHTHNAVIISDHEGRIEWVNKAYEKMTGFTLSESVGKLPGELLQGKKTDDNTVKRISNKLLEGVSFTEEILNYRKNGEKYWIKMDISPVKDESGEIKKFISIQEDITDRKVAESNLRESYRQLKRSQEIGNVGSWSYYIGDETFFWSDEMYNIYDRNRSLGPPTYEEVMEMADRDEENNTTHLIINALDLGTPFDKIIMISDAPLKYVQITGKVIKDNGGNTIGLEGTVRDVTGLKKTEDKLREANKQLSEVADSINGVLLQYNIYPDGSDDVTYLSAGSEKIYGIIKEDALEDINLIWNGVHQEDLQGFKQAIMDSAESLSNFKYSWRHLLPNGGLRYLEATGAPTQGKNGSTTWNTVVMDITEKVMAESRIEKANQQLGEIAGNINGVLMRYQLLKDGSDRLIYISEGAEEIFGITPEEALDDNSKVWEGVHKDDVSLIKKAIEISAQDLSTYSCDWRHILSDGSTRYLKARGTPSKLDDGSIIWNTIILDVTDQKMTELKEQELQQILKSTLNEIYIFDADTLNFVYCNNAAINNTGYSEEELRSLNPLDLKIGLSTEEFSDILKESDEMGGVMFETSHQRKDGSTYEVLIQVNPKIYKNKKVYVANLLDISDKKRVEESYMETNRKLRQLIDAAPIGVYLIDTEGVVIDFWNPAAERIFGYKREEVLGHFLPSVSKEDLDDFNRNMDAVKSGEVLSGKRLKRKHKNGKDVVIELNTGPIYKNGKLFEVLVLVQDVTELVRKEDDLTRALNDKDTLIQEVHHRVKNNLAIVSGILELQIMRGNSLPQLVDTKNRIMSIAAVHEQLYRTENFSDVETESYFQPLILKSKESFLGDDQTVVVKFNSNVFELNINEAIPMGLLLNELITNSVRHAFSGKDGTIEVNIEHLDSDQIKFSYRDSGQGFPKGHSEKSEGFGMELIRTLISQLTDNYKLETDNVFNLEFTFERKTKGSYSNM